MPEIAINRSWYILMFLLTFRLMTDNCCVLGLETGTPKLPSPQPKGKWIAIFFSKLNYSISSRLPHFSIYLNFFEQCCYLQFFSPSSSSEEKFSLFFWLQAFGISICFYRIEEKDEEYGDVFHSPGNLSPTNGALVGKGPFDERNMRNNCNGDR